MINSNFTLYTEYGGFVNETILEYYNERSYKKQSVLGYIMNRVSKVVTIEQEIKNQFSKVFESVDMIPFKQTADYYFEVAATLKKKNISAPEELKLWFRNTQKRLYIGLATEFILNALYLKNGFNINKPIRGEKMIFPAKISRLNKAKLNPSDTYTLTQLLEKLNCVINKPDDYDKIMEGLKICKVLRNKEGHVAVHWHRFNSKDFDKIEFSIVRLYEIGFSEDVKFKISMTKTQGSGQFELKQKTNLDNI